MIKIIRHKHNSYCIYDFIYRNDVQIGTQSNLLSKNRFKSKQYNFNGKTLNVDAWEWGEKR